MLIVGIHAVEAFLDGRIDEIEEIIVLKKNKVNPRVQVLLEKSRLCNVKVNFSSDLSCAQGVAAKVNLVWQKQSWCEWLQKHQPQKLVMLDGVQDPHNLGACMRTACALGVGAMIIPSRRAAPVNATAIKVASGAGAWLPVFSVNNIISCLKIIKDLGYWVICCSEHSTQDIKDNNFNQKKIIIVGNEEKGIKNSIMQQSDYQFRLPTSGPIKSLNVSVALGIALTLL